MENLFLKGGAKKQRFPKFEQGFEGERFVLICGCPFTVFHTHEYDKLNFGNCWFILPHPPFVCHYFSRNLQPPQQSDIDIQTVSLTDAFEFLTVSMSLVSFFDRLNKSKITSFGGNFLNVLK